MRAPRAGFEAAPRTNSLRLLADDRRAKRASRCDTVANIRRQKPVRMSSRTPVTLRSSLPPTLRVRFRIHSQPNASPPGFCDGLSLAHRQAQCSYC